MSSWEIPPATMQVFTRSLSCMTKTHDVHPTDTVGQLKCLGELVSGFPPSQQRLIFAGKQLEDDATLESCKIEHESTIHLVLKLESGKTASRQFDIVVPGLFRSRSTIGVGQEEEGGETQDHLPPFGPTFAVVPVGTPVDLLAEIWCRIEFIRARRRFEEKGLDGVGQEQFMSASIELEGVVWEHDKDFYSQFEGPHDDSVFSVVVPIGAGVKAASKR